jgi:molecular chaperone DnaK (HSP70)
MPSVVAYAKTGERLVGQIARRQAVMNPENTFYSVKRFIGRKFAEVTQEAITVSYKVIQDSNGNVKIDCTALKKQFIPEESSAQVLRKLVDDASKYLGEPITQAVITVPAYFNDLQRQATQDAGKIAGLEVLRITDKEPNQGVNPDEVVAMGATIQGGVLAGEVKDVLLLDVTPLSLGVETAGGVMTKIIPRNTTIPVRKSETFSTAADAQLNVEIHALQGERELANDNKSLGMFRLDSIPPSPRGVPQINVTFDLDANVLLSVTTKDRAYSKEQSITISGASTLDKGDVERMIHDAEIHAEDDLKRREQIDTKNNADSLVYQSEKQLQDLNGQVSESDKEQAQLLVGELRSAIAQSNYDRISSLTHDVQQALMKIGSAVSAQANAGATNSTTQAPGQSDDVVDADFLEQTSHFGRFLSWMTNQSRKEQFRIKPPKRYKRA